MKKFFYVIIIYGLIGFAAVDNRSGPAAFLPVTFFPTAFIPGAQAATEDYIVRNVSVDVVDQSSVKARDIAFTKAQEKAFQVLAQRYGRGNDAKPPAPQTLSTMIENFEIESEQNSRKRYRGVYTFRFRPSSVIGYFGGGLNGAYGNRAYGGNATATGAVSPHQTGGAPYGGVSEEVSDGVRGGMSIEEHKVLLIPFTQVGKDWALWDTKNNLFWVRLKDQLARESGEAPFILPQGTISDSTDIWEKSPNVIAPVSIKRIQARYGVDEVMIAAARAAGGGSVIDLYRTLNGRVELMGQLPVRVSVLDRDQSVYQKAAEQVIALARQDWQGSSAQSASLSEVYQAENGAVAAQEQTDQTENTDMSVQGTQKIISPRPVIQPFPAAASGAVGGAVGGATGGAVGVIGGSARFTYNYRSFAEWTRLQQFLKSSPAVASYSIKSLKTNGASVDISYRNWQNFTQECGRRGYHIRAATQAGAGSGGGYEIY